MPPDFDIGSDLSREFSMLGALMPDNDVLEVPPLTLFDAAGRALLDHEGRLMLADPSEAEG